MTELSKRFVVSPLVISRWKKKFIENLSKVFDKDKSSKNEQEFDQEKLFAQIDQLKVENDFLKKA